MTYSRYESLIRAHAPAPCKLRKGVPSTPAQAALHSEHAQKTYYAFTRGDASRAMSSELLENRAIKDEGGTKKEAQTRLQCVASCPDGSPERSSLIVARPVTGRWHQIRKHLSGLNHPILNDASHGDSKASAACECRLPRCLFARSLSARRFGGDEDVC